MKFALAITATLLAAPASAETLGPFTDLVIFGDSSVDSGNAASLGENFFDGFNFGLYPEGQFSNGDVWTTQLGAVASEEGGTNYSYGSARALENGDNIPDLGSQVIDFITSDPVLGERPLGIISIGGNDYRDFLMAGAGGGDLETITDFGASVINEITSAVFAMASKGISEIQVVTIPDIGRLPALVNSDFSGLASQIVAGTNAGLEATVNGLSAILDGTTIEFFDANFVLGTVLDDPGAFGFSEEKLGCIFVGVECDPESYVFWDDLHATEKFYGILANEFAATVAPVPLPGGLSLALGGFALLGFAAKRRKVA